MTAKIGFELEMLSPMNEGNFRANCAAIGIQFPDENGRNPYQSWRLHRDGSLRPVHAGHYGHELVSPVLDLEPGLAKLQQIFNWMTQNGHYTNSTCGLHMGVSFDPANTMATFDPLKLALVFDSRDVLDAFGRLGNRFCKPIREYLQTSIDRSFPEWVFLEVENARRPPPAHRAEMTPEQYIRSIMPQDKYCASNISKIRSPTGAYVEFRAMGGSEYEKRFDDVRSYTEYFVRCMEYSCGIGNHPDEERLYRRELGRLLRSTTNKMTKYKQELIAQQEREARARANAERRRAEREARERAAAAERDRVAREQLLLQNLARDVARGEARSTRAKELKAARMRVMNDRRVQEENNLWNNMIEHVNFERIVTPLSKRAHLRAKWAEVRRRKS